MTRTTRTRSRALGRAAAVAAVLLLLTGLAAEKVLVPRATTKLTSMLEHKDPSARAVQVSADGTLLPSLVRGHLPGLHVHASRMTVSSVQLGDVSLDAADIPARWPLTAGTVTVSAEVPWNQLQHRAGKGWAVSADNGAISIVHMPGREIQAQAVPAITAHGLHLKLRRFLLNGIPLPVSAVPSLLTARMDDLARPLAHPGHGLVLTSIAVTRTGLKVALVGHDQNLRSLTRKAHH